MEHDLHNRVKAKVALRPFSILENTTKIGNVIDTIGFESLEYFISVGAIHDGAYDFLLEEDDDSGFGSPRTLGPDEILGSTIGFTVDDQFSVKHVGSLGKKRFQRLSIVDTDVTSGLDNKLFAIAVLGDAYVNPVPDVFEML